MFGFVRGVRGRAAAVVLVVAALWGGVAASSVVAGPSTTVTWKVSSLTAGQVKSLSNVASSNSLGVKTWSKTGSCTLSPKSMPTKLTMGSTGSCTLTLKIAKAGKYPAKTSTKVITRKSATTTTVALTCATGGSCYVGDTGPGGGTIFFVDLTRAEGSQYFEAACAGWSDGTCGGSDLTDPLAEWGCNGTKIYGADGTAIGTGEQNTTAIVARCSWVGIVARHANDLVLGGQSDWFLPSKDELNQMYIRRTAIGGFSTDHYYWSSSEGAGNRAWFQSLVIGTQYNYYKDSAAVVRPVRAFSGSVAPTTTTTTTTTTTLAPVPLYSVGDTGPGGGTIFYVDLTRAEGSQYFEAACAGWSDGTCGGSDLTDPTPQWGCYGITITGADGTAIGTGEQNTTDIVNGCATAGSAAKLANDLVLGGQSDWFLPSKDELNQMYIRRTAIGGFRPDPYWSSSEFDDNAAWLQNFYFGDQNGYSNKNNSYYVRPVRAFSGSVAPTTTTTTTTTTVAPTTTTTLAPVPLYSVGDTGPGGGTIFYVDLTRAEGSQYFEAACAGWSDGTCGGSDLTDPTAPWGCFGTLIAGAVGTAIGTGEQNTTDIVNGCATAGSAAKLANDLVLGGQSDWFLPSKDELNQMYIRRTARGGFSTVVFYWSSSDDNGYSAWYQYFNDGGQGEYAKYWSGFVRPVRAF